MGSNTKTRKLSIGGMDCVNCQNKIERRLRGMAGVQKVRVSYSAGTAVVSYDAGVISVQRIVAAIEKLGYRVLSGGGAQQKTDIGYAAGILLIIVALYVIFEQLGILNLLVPGQLADAHMGYGMLFVIGLITSVHCTAMCGGINLSQCIPQSAKAEGDRFSTVRPTFLYNLGRVVSYTIVGFLVGALGSVITFSNTFQGILKLLAGVFMVIMGINMLGIFPWLRRFNPRMPQVFARKIDEEKANQNSPLIVGLLNGLMPCGPLQAMQIYALSTGNPFAGALSMFLFSLGTVPLMFGLGAVSSMLGKKFTHKAMTVGAVLVVVLGLSMLSQGWSLSGGAFPPPVSKQTEQTEQSGAAVNGLKIEDGVQMVNSTLSSGRYPNITVQAGTPVKWVIQAPQGSINGCNNRMLIPEYQVEHSFQTGENVVEFTPTKAGTFRYSCWMGMIRGTITVTAAN